MRIHIEYSHALDPMSWQARHEAGLVPDRLPYGLDRIAAHGFELSVRSWEASRPVRFLDGASRRLSGGFALVDALRDRVRRNCDVAFCWDERTGVPAAHRSRLPGEPPVVMQSIWLGDPGSELNRPQRALALAAAKRCLAVWANTTAQLDVLAGWGLDRRRLHLVHTPGIDDEFWTPTGEDPDPELVVTVGHDRHRDHDFVVRSLMGLRQRRPVRLELVTGPWHPTQVPPELGVRHGWTPHHELRRLYGRATLIAIALHPNLHVSGSTGILESMACARPVVVTERPGLDQYVAHGETGLLVPPDDERAFAAAVDELLSDPERAREMGLAARRRLEQGFSSRALNARLAEILHGVV
jgi:glycosyltransferase involved in cell wall biosynthesis